MKKNLNSIRKIWTRAKAGGHALKPDIDVSSKVERKSPVEPASAPKFPGNIVKYPVGSIPEAAKVADSK